MGFFDGIDTDEIAQAGHKMQENQGDAAEENVIKAEESVDDTDTEDGQELLEELLPPDGEVPGVKEEQKKQLSPDTEQAPQPPEKKPVPVKERDKEHEKEKVSHDTQKISAAISAAEHVKPGSDPSRQKKTLPSAEKNDSRTMLSAGTVIDSAGIRTDGDIIVHGTVNGKISAGGDMQIEADAVIAGPVYAAGRASVFGKVSGGIEAGSAQLAAKMIRGDITCKGDILVLENCAVLGTITTDGSVTVSGAVRGSICAKNKVHLNSGAAVQGNITALSIVIEEGAAIDGACTQLSVNEKLDSLFKEIDEAESDSRGLSLATDGAEDEPPIS